MDSDAREDPAKDSDRTTQYSSGAAGIFTITDGHMRTADIGGPGLGIPDDMVPR